MKTRFATAVALFAASAQVADALRYDDAGSATWCDERQAYVTQDGEVVEIDETATRDYYFDNQKVQKSGDYCKDDSEEDKWFFCGVNYSFEEGGFSVYRLGEDECWDPIKGWFSCAKVGCYAYRDQDSCAYLKSQKLIIDPDVGRNVTQAAQDWAQSQNEENEELLQNIADATGQLISNVGRNVTESLADAIDQSFDRIQNQTMQALNDTRSEILEGIRDARDELERELKGDSGKYAYYNYDDKQAYYNYDDMNAYHSYVGAKAYQSYDGENAYQSYDGENAYQSYDGENAYQSYDGGNAYQSYEGENAYYKNLNLLAHAQNEKTSATKIALCASAGVATAIGLLMARKRYAKSDEDFERV